MILTTNQYNNKSITKVFIVSILYICGLKITENLSIETHLEMEFSQCPLYDDLRQNVIGLLNPDLCFKDQFCSLMTNTNIQAVLGKLVFSIMQRRSGLLNI